MASVVHHWLRVAAVLTVALSAAAPVGASSLIRLGLEELVTASPTVVVGHVVDARSYWNEEGDFILTDVEVAVIESLKGVPGESRITVTLLGGSVGDLTTLIIGGAQLLPGRSYVLFLDRGSLHGVPRARTVAAHSQGVFDIVESEGGLRARSQARDHALVPDAAGRTEPPGGVRGIPLHTLLGSVSALAARGPVARPEVER